MEYIEQQFGAFGDAFYVMEIIAVVFLLLMVLETVWDYVSGKRRHLGETAANGIIAVGNTLLERTLFGFVFILGLFAVEMYVPLSLEENVWTWPLALGGGGFNLLLDASARA